MTTTTATITSAPLPAEVETLMRTLRLPHARAVAADVLATARSQRWDPAEVLKALLAEETAGRARSMLATRRKAAGFPTGKTFEAWDPAASSIPLPTQQALQTLEWVGRRENVVVCGPAGTGKTFFLEALGQKVIEAGMPVAWFTLEQIGVLVRAHRADDSLGKAIAKIVRAELIVIDDVGLLPVGADAAEGLYRIVEAAYERKSVAISSNLHPSGFDELMPKTLATATHLRNRFSCTFNSRATSVTERPPSITRRAASTLNSGVNDRRVRDIPTSFQQDLAPRYLRCPLKLGRLIPLMDVTDLRIRNYRLT